MAQIEEIEAICKNLGTQEIRFKTDYDHTRAQRREKTWSNSFIRCFNLLVRAAVQAVMIATSTFDRELCLLRSLPGMNRLSTANGI